MGGSGNSTRTGGTEPTKGGPFTPPPQTDKGTIKEPSEKRERGDKKPEQPKPTKGEFTKQLEAAEKARQEKFKSMSERQRAEARYVEKKAHNYFKKTGQISTKAQDKKWKADFKNYEKKTAARERADTERLWGKMTDKQYKQHVAKTKAHATAKAKAGPWADYDKWYSGKKK